MYLALKILRKNYNFCFKKVITIKNIAMTTFFNFIKEQFRNNDISNTKKYNLLGSQFKASFKYLAV